MPRPLSELPRWPRALELVRPGEARGRRALLTGANAGIGFETARALACAGFELHLAGRDPARLERARAALATELPAATLHDCLLDLADLATVSAAADRLAELPFDLLVFNAGVYGGSYARTAQGLERTLGICHFGHHYLLRRLLPAALRTPDPRVLWVASESHRSPPTLTRHPFPPPPGSSALMRYGQAKLANVLSAAEFQRRLGERARFVSLHPGSLVRTGITRHSLAARVLVRLVRPFTKSVEQAAATTVHCALSEELEGGAYYVDCRVKAPSPEARRPETAAWLHERSDEILAELGYPCPPLPGP